MNKLIFAFVLTLMLSTACSPKTDLSSCNSYAEKLYQDQSQNIINNIQDYCKPLAELGNAQAQYNYASSFMFTGDNASLEKWMKLAAHNEYAKAQSYMAGIYKYGTPDQVSQAIEWYEKASKNGIYMAPVDLGSMYHEGIGVKVDGIKAVYWFEYAANKHELTNAMQKLVEVYTNGVASVVPNVDKANYWKNKLNEEPCPNKCD